MRSLRVEVPPHVAGVVRKLPPDVKRSVKLALRALCQDPERGEPLRGPLIGLWRYRVRRFRIVYEVDRRAGRLRVFGVGPRRGIYEEVSDLVRRRARR